MRIRVILILGLVLVATAGIVSWFITQGVPLQASGIGEARLRAVIRIRPGSASARVELAKILVKREAYDDALAVLQEGLAARPEDRDLARAVATTWSDWAGQTRNAERWKEALTAWWRVIELGPADAEAYEALGDAELETNYYFPAVRTYAAAFKLAPNSIEIKAKLADAQAQTGKYEQALPALREVTKAAPDDYRYWSWLADAQIMMGDYEPAIASIKQALHVAPAEKQEMLAKLLHFTEALTSTTKSEHAHSVHSQCAQRHKVQGRPDRMAAEYQKAIDLLPLDSAQSYGYLGWCHVHVGEFYSDIGESDKGIEHINEAIEAFIKAQDLDNLSRAYEFLASAYAMIAEPHKGNFGEYYEKELRARELEEQYAKEAGNKHMARHALADKAEAMAKVYGNEDDRVKSCHQEMAQYIPKDGVIRDCSYASIVFWEAVYRGETKNYAEARKLFEMVAPYFLRSNAVEEMGAGADLFDNLAAMAWEQGDYDQAVRDGEKAVERLNATRAMFGIDECRRRIGGHRWQKVFDRLLRCALKKEDAPAAFNYAEQYKGRALLDLLGSKTETPEQQQRILLAQNETSPSHDDRDPTQNGVGAPATRRDLDVEQALYSRLPEDVAGSKKEVRSFAEGKSLNLEQVQAFAKDFDFVTYAMGLEGAATAVIVSGDAVHAVALDQATDAALREAIEQFRKALGIRAGTQRDLALENAVPESAQTPFVGENPWELSTRTLWDMLIEPVLPYLKTKVLYISPDGPLNYLPFEALSKNGRYLIEDYTVAYAPSATVLKFCMDKNRNRRESVLALGNPNLQNPAFRLVNAENEVNALKGLFPRADVYTFDDATEKVVKEHAGEYDILHFACHGELNLDDPMLTSLRLAPDDTNDGYLHAGEVFDLNLQASLVVLSACNSALGDLATGNELMGLTRSFLYAGAPSIIASLWTVDDRSTAALMQAFYRNLATMNKAEALRQAKLEIMKQYPSPFHWAAFCLQGDYR